MGRVEPLSDQETGEAIPFYQTALMVLSKVYLHGFIAMAVLYLLVTVVLGILPVFEGIANPALRVMLAILLVLLGPPLLGALIRFAGYPVVGRHRSLARFSRWDERLFADLDRAQKCAQIVIVNWPTQNLRTMGVLTRSFVDESTGETMAAVYVPSISKAQLSYVHVCRLTDVTMTNWTLKEWQLFHLSLGAFGPGSVETRTEQL